MVCKTTTLYRGVPHNYTIGLPGIKLFYGCKVFSLFYRKLVGILHVFGNRIFFLILHCLKFSMKQWNVIWSICFCFVNYVSFIFNLSFWDVLRSLNLNTKSEEVTSAFLKITILLFLRFNKANFSISLRLDFPFCILCFYFA